MIFLLPWVLVLGRLASEVIVGAIHSLDADRCLAPQAESGYSLMEAIGQLMEKSRTAQCEKEISYDASKVCQP